MTGRRVGVALQIIAMAALAGKSAAALPADLAWLMNYAGRSTNTLVWDARFNRVIGESLPTSLVEKVQWGLGGPPNPVLVVGQTLSASACVPHSCPDKGFFWIDTASATAFGASASLWGCDAKPGIQLPCELLLGSRRIPSAEAIPPLGKRALMHWMNENDIRVNVFRFINAANEITELEPAAFRLAERFHPPATGPSFDCHRLLAPIEKAICGNPQLSKLDLEMAGLYGKMHLSYATVEDREQLRSLQSAWLARLGATCPVAADQVQCLAAEYEHQHDVLENWLPIREMQRNP